MHTSEKAVLTDGDVRTTENLGSCKMSGSSCVGIQLNCKDVYQGSKYSR